MRVSFKLARVQFFDTDPVVNSEGRPAYDPGIDGIVDYECAWIETETPDAAHSFHIEQPFSRLGATVMSGRHVWAWDGNRESPTLSPSFRCDFGPDRPEIHIHFQQGRIVDSGSRDVVYG